MATRQPPGEHNHGVGVDRSVPAGGHIVGIHAPCSSLEGATLLGSWPGSIRPETFPTDPDSRQQRSGVNAEPDQHGQQRRLPLSPLRALGRDAAQVYLLPHPNSCSVVSHWNGQVWRAETVATQWEAEQLAWRWWVELHSPPKKAEPPPEPKKPVNWTPPGLMWTN